MAVLQVERVAGGLSTFGDDDAIRATGRDRHIGGEGVRAVACGWSQCVVEAGCSGIEGVERPASWRRRVRMLPSGDARIDGVDVIRLRFAIEQGPHLLEFSCICHGHIMRFGVILRQVVKLPR